MAGDLEHRLTAEKLARIFDKAKTLLGNDDLEVDVEHELGFISQFPLESVTTSSGEVVLRLTTRHTACLAQDQCCPPAPTFDLRTLTFTPAKA